MVTLPVKDTSCPYPNCLLPLTPLIGTRLELAANNNTPVRVNYEIWACPTGRHGMEPGSI